MQIKKTLSLAIVHLLSAYKLSSQEERLSIDNMYKGTGFSKGQKIIEAKIPRIEGFLIQNRKII